MTSFETDFWLPYDKKVGKDKCITKWALIPAEDQIKIKLHVPGFVSRARNKQFRPNPLTYLNGKMWLDENIETEGKIVYREIPDKPVSDYEAKEFLRSKGIQHMREKLKANYENGTPIKDWGGIYTKLLKDKCGMEFTESVINDIEIEVHREATRPRKRSEGIYSLNVDSDVRDRCLNWFLGNCRDKGIKLHELI